MKPGHVLAVMAVLCLLVSGPAVAQVTGSITGYVFDQSGAPVAGATVKVSGELIPAGRTVTTPASGQVHVPVAAAGRLHDRRGEVGNRHEHAAGPGGSRQDLHH